MKIKIPKLKLPVIKMFGIDIVKNFLFLTLFIILSLTLLGTMAAPAIKYFKKQKYEYIKQKQIYETEKNRNNKIIKEYNRARMENAKTILAFNRDFNKKSFINFASKELKNIKIEDLNISVYKKDFIKKSYIVKCKIDTPKNIYKFIDKVKDYKNVLEIKLPVKIESKNGAINLEFRLNHIKNK